MPCAGSSAAPGASRRGSSTSWTCRSRLTAVSPAVRAAGPGDPQVAPAAGDAAGVELVDQGQGVLAGDAERVAELRDGEPVRSPRQQAGRGRGGRVDGGRREVDAVALDHQAPPDQLPELGPVDAVRRGGAAPPASSAGEERVVGQRIGGGARPGPAVRDVDVGHAAEDLPLALVERGDVEPERSRRRDPRRRTSTIASTAPGATTQRPTVGGRRSPVSASSSSAVDPPPFGDDPVRDVARPLRPAAPSTPAGPAPRRAPRRRRRSRSGRTRAARSGRPAAAARAWSRWRRTRPRRRVRWPRRRAPAPHRVLARADVGHVGASPGHVVVELGEHGQRGVAAAPSAASGRARRRRRPGPRSVARPRPG